MTVTVHYGRVALTYCVGAGLPIVNTIRPLGTARVIGTLWPF